MDMNNLTRKTVEALQTAQKMAAENRNSTIMPEHLLYALIDADGGLIGSLFGKLGADVNAVLGELDAEIAKLPGAEDLSVGEQVYLQGVNGQPVPVRVVAKDEEIITFDANHEMAGKELNFTIELLEVQ